MKYQQEINELLNSKDLVDRHSFFQLKYFVIGKEPTIQAKLWRCLKELKTRNESLLAIEDEIADKKDDLILLNLQKESLTGSLSTETEQIAHRKKQRQITALERHISDLERKLKFTYDEAEFFYLAFKSLVEKEEVKPFDDLKSQEEYWNEKLSQELNMKLLLRHPIDLELIKTILALKDDSPVKQFATKLLVAIDKDTRKALEDHKG